MYIERFGSLKEDLPLGVHPGNQVLHLEGAQSGNIGQECD